MGELKKQACVVVLGDWGRSPRMQYHALSLAKNEFLVDIVAYVGADPHEAVKNNEFITHNYLKKVPKFETYLPRLLVYIFKTLWQSLFLFTMLLHLTRPDVLIVQNPPSIPTLPVCWFVCWLRKTKLIIDYHNYGYTILAFSAGKNHILVKICKWCEKYFGQKAAHTFCVTQAMQEDLAKNWNVRSTVFYDCPPEIFRSISTEEKHSFFYEIRNQREAFKISSEYEEIVDKEYSRFSVKEQNNVKLLDKRPPLIVSSTSWTADEDFSLLLEALCEYEKEAAQNPDFPNLVVAITGKGPLKSMYEKLIAEKNFHRVEIVTLWLAAKNYPILLGCADLGVCLHCSTSGLDLPMKVVDMFGCELPVCAFYYPCIKELVKGKVNGLCFSDSKQLSDHLKRLFKGFPQNTKELQSYKDNLKASPLPRWDKNWNERVLPVLTALKWR